MLLRCEPPATRGARPLAARRDFEVLHSAHADWVTRLEHIPGAATAGGEGLRSGGVAGRSAAGAAHGG